MSRSGIEWIPSPTGQERTIRIAFRLVFALLGVFLGAMMLSFQGTISVPPLSVLGFTFGMVGVAATLLALTRLSRVRPGIFELGVSRDGLTVRYPLGTQTYGWSELWWSNDGLHVEGRSWLGGPGLLTLSPTQLERIQRAVCLR
jgi:hypothetical protein